MRGHDEIIKMRCAGKRPEIVFLYDFPILELRDWYNPGEKYSEVWETDHAKVEIEASDAIRHLDFRFLKGVRVSISSGSMERAQQLFDAAKQAGATTVAACQAYEDGPFNRIKTGWSAIYHA